MDQSKSEITRRPPNRNFASIVARVGEYQADIMFMPFSASRNYLRINKSCTCILLLIEPATRFAYAAPMLNKSAPIVLDRFSTTHQHIIAEDRLFTEIFTDQGPEFCNALFDDYCTRNGIAHRVKAPADEYSLGMIDSLCRTYRAWINDWQTLHESESWLDALPEITRRYNEHEIAIRTRPRPDASQILWAAPRAIRASDDLQDRVRSADMSRGAKGREHAERFIVGDKVRVRIAAQPLIKGGDHWSHRVYTIIGKPTALSFTLADSDASVMPRTYRAHELLNVPQDSVDVPDIHARSRIADLAARRMRKEGI